MAQIEHTLHQLRGMQRRLARIGITLAISDPDAKLKALHPDAAIAASTKPPVRLAWHMTADGRLHCGTIACAVADIPDMIAEANIARANDIKGLWSKICDHLDANRPHPLPDEAAERVREYERTAAELQGLRMDEAPAILNDGDYETLTHLDSEPRPGDTGRLTAEGLLEPAFDPESTGLRLTGRGLESIELTESETR